MTGSLFSEMTTTPAGEVLSIGPRIGWDRHGRLSASMFPAGPDSLVLDFKPAGTPPRTEAEPPREPLTLGAPHADRVRKRGGGRRRAAAPTPLPPKPPPVGRRGADGHRGPRGEEVTHG